VRDGLRRLLEDRELREGFRTRCATVAQELSWDEPVRIMEEVYTRVIADRCGVDTGPVSG
jgi:hypothetical protein